MAPKRAATTTHSVSVHTGSSVKMMKIGMDHSLEDFGEVIEEKYRIPDDGYSPIEGEPITFEEEDDQSPETRTDTITLLMKIDQLQAELKYERRCRQMAERELKQMKEMNDLMTQMRHTAHDLRTVLDHARGQQGNDVNDVVNDAVTPESCEGQSISYADVPVQMSQVVSQEVEDANYIHLPGGLRVQRNLYKGISEIMDFKKYISAMLMVLFDRETLGTHSLQGRRCNIAKEETQKPQLPPDIMRGLLDHVRIKFGVDYSAIRAAVRTKLNNEDKLLKKRLGIR
ncbi:uncharacterized protein LOC135541672 isoform X2 [Oncorhynchus masou masou]|uniref:uncharacterized protein LOC115150324 n=1 Tax=Salmo trutta TaxID=8032 RepID=UPI0011314A53|nr:uncharacterized protein LOC115150324 [Salmo trutta]XP_029549349.1 uncharacterized protein LOC115150324 [Salmo trutta]